MILHNRWVATPEDHEAVKRVLDSGHVGQGPEVEAFEREFSERFCPGLEAVAVSSGTAALHLALRAEGVWDGDRVLLPTYACSALYNAVRMTGAGVELGDVCASDFNLDPRVKPWHKCKAAVYVHTYGVPGPIPEGVVIEDCSHALGASYNGKPVGTMGSLGMASLGPTKLLGTPGGGVVFGPADRIAYIRDLRDYDQKDSLKDRGNWSMSDVHAAIARVRLARFDRDLTRREDIAERYYDGYARPATRISIKSDRVWYRFVIPARDWLDGVTPFSAAGIQTIMPLTHAELLHRMMGEDRKRFPVAEDIVAHTLSLPIYPSLTDEEVTKVCDVLGRLEA